MLASSLVSKVELVWALNFLLYSFGIPRTNHQAIYMISLRFFQTFPAWVEMKSLSQAKSKIGHAVMKYHLQVRVLEKFKSIPIVTSLVLACFSGALFPQLVHSLSRGFQLAVAWDIGSREIYILMIHL